MSAMFDLDPSRGRVLGELPATRTLTAQPAALAFTPASKTEWHRVCVIWNQGRDFKNARVPGGSRPARCTERGLTSARVWNMTRQALSDADLGIPIRRRFASGSRISISYPHGASSTFTPNSFANG